MDWHIPLFFFLHIFLLRVLILFFSKLRVRFLITEFVYIAVHKDVFFLRRLRLKAVRNKACHWKIVFSLRSIVYILDTHNVWPQVLFSYKHGSVLLYHIQKAKTLRPFWMWRKTYTLLFTDSFFYSRHICSVSV